MEPAFYPMLLPVGKLFGNMLLHRLRLQSERIAAKVYGVFTIMLGEKELCAEILQLIGCVEIIGEKDTVFKFHRSILLLIGLTYERIALNIKTVRQQSILAGIGHTNAWHRRNLVIRN